MIAALAAATGSRAARELPPYRVIVHPSNEVAAVDRTFLTQAFLKKVRRWPGGAMIEPVDLDPDAPARERYTLEVMGRSVSAVKSYWQQLIFSGRGLPPELDTDDDVVRFVLRQPGAIGYVSGQANVRTARVVPLK